jgi:hypothetical protein
MTISFLGKKDRESRPLKKANPIFVMINVALFTEKKYYNKSLISRYKGIKVHQKV